MIRRSIILFGLLLGIRSLFAGDQILEIKDIGYDQVYYKGFVLNHAKDIRIHAVGAGGNKEIRRSSNSHIDKFNMFAYAWILNAESREMVWRMTIENTDREPGSDWMRTFDGKVHLKAGSYEVYYSAVEPSFISLNGGFITLGKVLKRIFSSSDEWDDEADLWTIRIDGVTDVLSTKEIKERRFAEKEAALVSITGLRDYKRYVSGITLTQPLDVQIYALGEGFKGKMFDYAWIINAQTRKHIWTMKEADTDYAGGAQKNRVVRERLHLKSGDYLIYYKLDDSHSLQEWNSNPPYDPFYWGIIIRSMTKTEAGTVKPYSERSKKPIVSITRVGDYASKEAQFKLTKPSKIRILAEGEGRDGDMFDYGWIVNMETGKTVWKMRYSRTTHAGGASKNRLFDGVIDLDAGEYMVYFQSDDSHSYEGWNMAPPDEPEWWGISIFPVDKSTFVGTVREKKVKKQDVLAQLIHVGDDEHVRKQFHLSKRSRIRIYCIGEGDEDDMYDYGWIRNLDTGDLVWKMRYRNTQPAGGADKNRKADTIITLDPGDYIVHYRSDDSHSYHDWNTTPPRDKENWGITIYDLSK